MKQTRLLIGTIVAVILLTAMMLMTRLSVLRGSLTGSGTLPDRVMSFADTNSDGTLSAREARRALVATVRGVALQDAAFDANMDGTVNILDTMAMVGALRQLLAAVCGNAITEVFEECDDGNTAVNDGCNAACVLEQGFTCTGSPSICTLDICGNGIIESTEQCDDDNTGTSDGCTFACRITPGFQCSGEPSECRQTGGTQYLTLTTLPTFPVTGPLPVAGPNETIPLFTFKIEIPQTSPLLALPAPRQGTFTLATDIQYLKGKIDDFVSFTLKSDTDGDGTFETTVRSGMVSTLFMGYRYLPLTDIAFGDAPVTFELYGTLKSSLEEGNLQFGIINNSNYGYAYKIMPGIVKFNDGSGPVFVDNNGLNGSCTAPVTECPVGIHSVRGSGPFYTIDPVPVVCGNGVIERNEICDDGNAASGDGCSNVCQKEAGYNCISEPSRCTLAYVNEGKDLMIDSIALPPSGTASPGQKVKLLAFTATNSGKSLMSLGGFRLRAVQGSESAMQSFEIRKDTNKDGVTDATITLGAVTRSGNDVLLPIDRAAYAGVPAASSNIVLLGGSGALFEIYGTLGSATYTPLKFAFATQDDALEGTKHLFLTQGTKYVAAQDAQNFALEDSGVDTNGICITSGGPGTLCKIHVKTATATLWSAPGSPPIGSLTVTPGPTSLRSLQLLGGTLVSTPVLSLNFKAESEAIDVSGLRLEMDSPASQSNRSLDSVELSFAGAPSPFVTATKAACNLPTPSGTAYCASIPAGAFIVPAGQSKEVLVRVRMENDVDGAHTNDRVTPRFAAAVDAVQARGVDSNIVLWPNEKNGQTSGQIFIGQGSPTVTNTDITGLQNMVVNSKILSVTANGPANSSAMPSGPDVEVGSFRFLAAANANTRGGVNRSHLYQMYFTVEATNVQLDGQSFRAFNENVPSSPSLCGAVDGQGQFIAAPVTGTFLVQCSFDDTDPTFDIAQNSALMLDLRADVLNTAINPAIASTLSVSIKNLSNPANQFVDPNQPFLGNFSPTGSHFVWLDMDSDFVNQIFWMEHPLSIFEVRSTLYSCAAGQCETMGGFELPPPPPPPPPAPSAACGDGVTEGTESCDDGNTASGDGCSDTCVAEPNFVCSGAPSSCMCLPQCPAPPIGCSYGQSPAGECICGPMSCSAPNCGNGTCDEEETADAGAAGFNFPPYYCAEDCQ